MPRDNTRVLGGFRIDRNQYRAAERTPTREEHEEVLERRGRTAIGEAGGA